MQLILIEKNTPTKLQTIQSSKKKKMLLELIIWNSLTCDENI